MTFVVALVALVVAGTVAALLLFPAKAAPAGPSKPSKPAGTPTTPSTGADSPPPSAAESGGSGSWWKSGTGIGLTVFLVFAAVGVVLAVVHFLTMENEKKAAESEQAFAALEAELDALDKRVDERMKKWANKKLTRANASTRLQHRRNFLNKLMKDVVKVDEDMNKLESRGARGMGAVQVARRIRTRLENAKRLAGVIGLQVNLKLDNQKKQTDHALSAIAGVDMQLASILKH